MTDLRSEILIREAAQLALEAHGRRFTFDEACDHLREECAKSFELFAACNTFRRCASLFCEEQRGLPIPRAA